MLYSLKQSVSQGIWSNLHSERRQKELPVPGIEVILSFVAYFCHPPLSELHSLRAARGISIALSGRVSQPSASASNAAMPYTVSSDYT